MTILTFFWHDPGTATENPKPFTLGIPGFIVIFTMAHKTSSYLLGRTKVILVERGAELRDSIGPTRLHAPWLSRPTRRVTASRVKNATRERNDRGKPQPSLHTPSSGTASATRNPHLRIPAHAIPYAPQPWPNWILTLIKSSRPRRRSCKNCWRLGSLGEFLVLVTICVAVDDMRACVG